MAAEVSVRVGRQNGEAERSVVEILLEMDRFNYRAGEGHRSDHSGASFAEAPERVSLPVVWAWAAHLNFP